MANMGEHTNLEPKSVAEYRQTADAHAQELKSFWKRFAVSGLFVIAAVIIVFACLAWFAANNRVQAKTSSLSAKADRFTLVAEGEGEEGAHVGYYERDGQKVELDGLTLSDSMVVTSDSNLNNDTKGSLYPGARGSITFTITPLVNGLKEVTVKLSRVLKMGDKVVDSKTVAKSDAGLSDDQTSAWYLTQGHLLFFLGCTTDGYYTNRVAGDTITIPEESFKDENGDKQAVEITLYWVWPEYIQNFILVGNANYYKNLFASVGENENSDYRSMQAFINANKSMFYYGASDGVETSSAPSLEQNMSSGDIATCGALYNNADELIGKNVQYVQLRLSASESIATSGGADVTGGVTQQ